MIELAGLLDLDGRGEEALQLLLVEAGKGNFGALKISARMIADRGEESWALSLIAGDTHHPAAVKDEIRVDIYDRVGNIAALRRMAEAGDRRAAVRLRTRTQNQPAPSSDPLRSEVANAFRDPERAREAAGRFGIEGRDIDSATVAFDHVLNLLGPPPEGAASRLPTSPPRVPAGAQ
ncbi:hypothetical protein [Winogradskya humida]|uniref:hypothetical protein n=1 Tax=Winogradskya humida TaxID=113566 RepID=UPI0019435AFF|nr:hypothetical protein [Actinoplanes humidus]